MPHAASLDTRVQELLTVERRFDAALLSSDVKALDEILAELSNQYLIAYVPPSLRRDSAEREVNR